MAAGGTTVGNHNPLAPVAGVIADVSGSDIQPQILPRWTVTVNQGSPPRTLALLQLSDAG